MTRWCNNLNLAGKRPVRQREIFDKPLPFTDSQTTHRVGHDSSGSNSCMSEPSPSGTSFPLHQELGSNYTGPLGSQLCKRIHNKPTEQTSSTCSPQGAPLLKRGHSEPYRRGSEYAGQECDIKSLPKTRRFPIPTLHGFEKRWGPKAHHQPEEAQLLCANRTLQDGGHSHAQSQATG